MGKDVFFYCIDKGCAHQKDKICLGWDYQPEDDSKYFDVMEALGMPPALSPDHRAVWDAFEDGRVCARCTWFFQSGTETPMVLSSFPIHHSYSNPVLRSDWFIDQFVWGGDVAREYDRRHGEVYRLSKENIANMREKVKEMGQPMRVSDREACEETLEAINWAESMFMEHPGKDIDLLFFGEY